MSKQERDILEEMFHAKLHDHEVDTHPADWEMIMNRLPDSKPVVRTFHRRWLYSTAAAIAALVVSTGILFLKDSQSDLPMVTEHTGQPTQKTTEQPKEIMPEHQAEIPLVAVVTEPVPATTVHASASITRTTTVVTPSVTTPTEVPQDAPATSIPEDVTKNKDINEPLIAWEPASVTPESQPVIGDKGSHKKRRWGFGMGGGSLTASTNNTFNTLMSPQAAFTQSMMVEDQGLVFLNTVADHAKSTEDFSSDFVHKTPVSVGLSASYYLTDRWSIQAGLSYSMLVSELKQDAKIRIDGKRKLHFVGIPVSVAYKIAEWQKLQLYASAGVMPELNVAGQYKTQLNNEPTSSNVIAESSSSNAEKVRAKELFWSVNARTGVSYPIIRFVNAFAEVGAAYHFDNNSEVKTIYSEKPFNVSFNFGLRFGF